MPNVEIHGYPKGSYAPYQLKPDIKDVLRKIGLGDEAVVTVASTETEGCNDYKPAPFLRIISSDPQEPDRIVQALEEAGIDMDIEVLPPIRFKKKGERWSTAP